MTSEYAIPDELPVVAPPPAVTEMATPGSAGQGVTRCVRCGASDVVFVAARGTLMCEFCRHEWTEASLDEQMGLSDGIGDLVGTHMSTAAADITDTEAMVTLKCTGCGAEVVINTDENLAARCHWCKHTLSLNDRIPNGAVPDGILPFHISKEQAMASIQSFVDDRKAFAHPDFAASFKAENVMGVYIPYMTVDGNITARLDGVGEVHKGRIKVGDNRYQNLADQYSVMRSLDLHIDDLIVETSSDKVNIHSDTSTNNIINAVLPFDVKNIVRFNAGFLGSQFTSERRDMNIDEANHYANNHFMTIARGAVSDSISGYTRGVRWDAEQINIKGTRWLSVLLPVWLYGFVEQTKNGPVTHYIAVNARSGATMGSVPINKSKARMASLVTGAVVSAITWPIALIVLVVG